MFVPKKTVGRMVSEAQARIDNLTNAQLRAEMERGAVQVVDIRDVRERQSLGWIPGSFHVPRGMLEFWLDPTSEVLQRKGGSGKAHRAPLRRRAPLGAGRSGADRHGVSGRCPPRARLQRLGRGRFPGRGRQAEEIMSRLSYGLTAASVVAALGAGTWFWWQQSAAPEPVVPQAAPVAAAQPPAAQAAPAEPVAPPITHPIEAAAPVELPPLAESDDFVIDALVALLGKKPVLSLLQTDGFVRRVVATVDNLARAHAAPRLWPVNPMPGRFAVTADNIVKPNNDERYTAFVLLVESVDTARAVALYVRLYPLFQRAYVELGYPDGYFNDRLVAVIDTLLATPIPLGPRKVELTQIRGEIKSERPWVRYQFSDPALESLTSGQKMLLRSGAVNQRRLRAKLTEIRALLVRGTLRR